jgi:hypothetical protein
MPDWLLILIVIVIVVLLLGLFIWWWMKRKPVAASGPGAEASASKQPYGPGSAAPLIDGSGPVGFTIKGNADSMLYHTTESPYYERTKAEVWFRTEADATRAGFGRWDKSKA